MRIRIALHAIVLVLCLLGAAPASGSDWKPLDPAHLALKEPKVEPTADAEALLWEVRVADELNNYGDMASVFQHYLRIKIFTDRGREAFATVDIPYSSGMDVKDVAARTIRPDGSIVELKNSDIYRRTILKAHDLKIKAVSFAVPAMDRGVIVEYRWREVHRDSLAANLRLRFSRDIPVHLAQYYVRPISVPGYSMIAWPFNGQFGPPEKQRDGYTMMALANVAADLHEEYGLPEFEQRPWVFIGYEPNGRSSSPNFAKQLGGQLHEEYSKRSKPNDAIRTLAAQAVVGATTDAERVAALVKVARRKVRRADVDTADPEDLRKARESANAADALNRGIGTADDVVLLFLSLARAAGLDARVAATANRGDLFPRSVRAHPYFTRGRIVAIRSGAGWLFADPTNEYAARGELPWEYEDQRVLVADAREALYAQTPLSPAAYSVKKRTGTFRLLDDGTLEGEARLEYTGHWADIFREQEDQDAPSERAEDVRQLVTKRLPGAELSDVRVENVTEFVGPYTNAYRIRIPGYAQRTGSRLLLQPSVFQKGVDAMFAGADRKSGIYFPFPWTEEDVITIALPEGYSVEESAARKPMDVGAASYEANLVIDSGTRLVIRRTLVVGKEGIFFDQPAYMPFRAFFDAVHRADAQTVVLQRKGGSQ